MRVAIAVGERASRGTGRAQAVRGVPGEAVGPSAGWLLQAQTAAQSRGVVSVSHCVAAPRAVFALQEAARVIRILRRSHGVNHVSRAKRGQ